MVTNSSTLTLKRASNRDQRVRFANFSVEMETGTGKTYVYLRTALELNRRYGFTKFVIVVPSVAIHSDGDCRVVFVRDKNYLTEGAPKFFHVREVRVGATLGGAVVFRPHGVDPISRRTSRT